MHTELRGSIEENIVSALVWREECCQEIAFVVTSEIFSTRYFKEIVTPTLKFIEQFGKPPKAHLWDLLENVVRKTDAHSQVVRDAIKNTEKFQADLNIPYILSELDNFLRSRRMYIAIEEAAELIEAGELDKAADLMVQTSFGGDPRFTDGIWLNNSKQVLTFLERREEDYLPLGIGTLDEMGVRPARKTLTILLGGAKRGKSWFLINAGKEALLHRLNVLHVSLENSQEMTALRYVQTVCAMTAHETKTVNLRQIDRTDQTIEFSTSAFTANSATEENRAKLTAKLKVLEHRGRLLIKEFPTGSLTVNQLNAYLDYLKQHDNFEPDILLLDYMDLMTIDSAMLRVDTGRITRDLRGLAVKRRIALVTVSQVNREGAEARVVRATHVAEDWSKIATADLVLTYNQTPDERRHGFARIFVAAARNMRDQFVVLITQNYSIGQFCLDSVFFSNNVETVLKEELDKHADTDE